MSEQPTFVDDDGDLRKYRTETPNMIYDMGLDPYEGWLYQHLKRIAGDSGVCWKGTRQLAHATGMSKSQVSRAKAELVSRQLISITTGDRANGQADEIRIANLWRENFEHFAPLSPTDTGCPSHEHPCPSHEHKKEPLRASTETVTNVTAKKSAASLGSDEKPESKSKQKRVEAISDEEAERRWRELCETDRFGDELRRLGERAAAKNKTGKKSVSALWRNDGERYVARRSKGDLSEEAWAYGFEQTLGRSIGSIGYVISCARGYQPGANVHHLRQRGAQRGATAMSGHRAARAVGADEVDFNDF